MATGGARGSYHERHGDPRLVTPPTLRVSAPDQVEVGEQQPAGAGLDVGLEHRQCFRTPARLKAPAPNTPGAAPREATQSRKHGQETVLQARLKAAEARLEDVLRERDEALKLLDHAIQQLDRLQQMAEP